MLACATRCAGRSEAGHCFHLVLGHTDLMGGGGCGMNFVVVLFLYDDF